MFEFLKKNIHYYIIWAFWFVLIYSILLSFTPVGGSNVSYEYKKGFSFVFPQGWGFFTKSPREALVHAYEIKKGDTLDVTINNFSSENLFGLSRKSRYISYELSLVLSAIPRTAWEQQIGNQKSSPLSKIDTISLKARLNYFEPGEYVILQHTQLPFSWINRGQEQHTPYLRAHIRIK